MATKAKKSGTKKPEAKSEKSESTSEGAKKSEPKSTKKDTGKMSALDAAAKVLGGSQEPMGCKEMIEAMAAKKLWTSPGGKTPSATLYSSILREINTKGKESRFKKAERGKFVATGK